uniref:Ribosomal RNA methyltransferase FtsJ domain-containing protein n=1 Tax=Peronospora matthiolae TaxID=2874970 RepID=A0AAV1TCQ2_9STRA
MADVVLGDMAPSVSDNFLSDSRPQSRLCHNAHEKAELYLRPGVKFVAKVLHCG